MQIIFSMSLLLPSLSNSETTNTESDIKDYIYIFHLGVTVEGLEAEVLTLEQKIASLEMRLLSLPPNDDTALELTINLSALEDQLQVSVYSLDSNHSNNIIIVI